MTTLNIQNIEIKEGDKLFSTRYNEKINVLEIAGEKVKYEVSKFVHEFHSNKFNKDDNEIDVYNEGHDEFLDYICDGEFTKKD